MRIIAGTLGGRRLVAPRGSDTRPTSDKVRQAVFNILGRPRPALDGDGDSDGTIAAAPTPAGPFRVLDLFAGSGALGLEAISRGADEAVLVDQDRDAAAAATRNVELLGLAGRVRVVRAEVGSALRSLGPTRFDWIFVDPPYGTGALDRALRLLGPGTLLAPEGVIVAEHDAREPPADRIDQLVLDDRRAWGHTGVSFYRLSPPDPAPDPATDVAPRRGPTPEENP